MKTFRSLLDPLPGEMPSETQRRARSGLAQLVAETTSGSISLRDPDRALPAEGRCLALGVASYSLPDLDLIDRLVRALRDDRRPAVRVELFDVLDCDRPSDFARFVPGIGEVRTAPVLAVYSDGQLVSTATGLAEVSGALRQFLPLKDAA